MIPRSEIEQMKLAKLFNKFAGKEVRVKETHHIVDVGGQKFPVTEVTPDPNDPTLRKMNQLAKAKKLKLRVWFPGSMGTMDFRMDRMNAHVEKGADGKYRVANKFNIG